MVLTNQRRLVCIIKNIEMTNRLLGQYIEEIGKIYGEHLKSVILMAPMPEEILEQIQILIL